MTSVKDQTYALYNLTQDQLSKTLMPVGKYSKDEVRKIAENIGLLVAHKPDSQDICFVPDGDYATYIEENTAAGSIRPGNFVTLYSGAEKGSWIISGTSGICTGNPSRDK